MRILFKTYILLLFGFNSCSLAITEPKQMTIKEAFILNSSPDFQGYFYLGTDAHFHNFEAKWKYKRDQPFKIGKQEALIESTYKAGTEEREVDLIKTQKAIAMGLEREPYIVLKQPIHKR